MRLSTPLDIGRQLLAADALYNRVPVGERDACIAAALDRGTSLAMAVRDAWGTDPDAIAAGRGVPVVDTESSADFGTTIVFANYATRPLPGCIFLYRPAIARAEAVLARTQIAVAPRIGSARALYLAHELFHHFDGADGALPAARCHPVTLLAFGRWRWTSGLASLAEIAAGAFAQKLLGLRTHPHALDLLVCESLECESLVRESLASDSPVPDPLVCDPPVRDHWMSDDSRERPRAA